MRIKLRPFISAASILLLVTAPLYCEDVEDNWAPDLTGVWTSEVVGYVYEDITDPGSEPILYEGSLDYELVITHQAGRAFAGTIEGRKLAGVIMPDRTVSIQYYEPSEERIFITGRLARSGETPQISGYMHFFDDFHFRELPDNEGDKMMATGYIRLIKVD